MEYGTRVTIDCTGCRCNTNSCWCPILNRHSATVVGPRDVRDHVDSAFDDYPLPHGEEFLIVDTPDGGALLSDPTTVVACPRENLIIIGVPNSWEDDNEYSYYGER